MSEVSTHAAANQALAVATPEGDATLPLRAAARAAGVSESTVRRLVGDGLVEAIRGTRGTLRLTQSTVVELRSGVRKRGPSLGAREAERARGALAAEVFRLLRSATPVDLIVERLEADPATVRALVDEFIKCREVSARLLGTPEAALGPAPAAVEAAARARGER